MKYGNKKVWVGGIKFDSKKEASYYTRLLSLKEKGEVLEIETQPVLEIFPSFRAIDGKKQRAITYIPDFKVMYKDGLTFYVDVKGVKTEVFKIKWKMARAQFETKEVRFLLA